MKNKLKWLLRSLTFVSIAVLVVFTGCDKDDDPEPDVRQTDAEFVMLTDYLSTNSMDISDILDGWITTADAVNTIMTDGDATNDYYIIDIRSNADYILGHIDGAINCAYGDILDSAANAGGNTILVTCYTGQTAGHAVVALRLSSYADAKSLKWGMSGWNSTLDKWSANTGSDATSNANWIPAPGSIAANVEYDDPDLVVTAADGAGILAERVQVLLTTGFQGIVNGDVLTTPTDYCINNYWAESDVIDHGNITTAFRINPLTIAGGELKYLNPAKDVVTYCWSGQTSSIITAYLIVLGYDAKSLKFGSNGMIYDILLSHKWAVPSVDLPIVP